jgi:hypothetical protein
MLLAGSPLVALSSQRFQIASKEAAACSVEQSGTGNT